jgi:hypothetical protein
LILGLAGLLRLLSPALRSWRGFGSTYSLLSHGQLNQKFTSNKKRSNYSLLQHSAVLLSLIYMTYGEWREGQQTTRSGSRPIGGKSFRYSVADLESDGSEREGSRIGVRYSGRPWYVVYGIWYDAHYRNYVWKRWRLEFWKT